MTDYRGQDPNELYEKMLQELYDQAYPRLSELNRESAEHETGERDLSVKDLREQAKPVIKTVLDEMAREAEKGEGWVWSPTDEDEALRDTLDRLYGLGRLQRLIEDDDIENINVNGYNNVWVKYAEDAVTRSERASERAADGTEPLTYRQKYPRPIARDDADLVRLIRHAATTLGTTEQTFNAANPQVDMQLREEGHRLSAVMGVAHVPSMSIRRHRQRTGDTATLDFLRGRNAIDSGLQAFLVAAVRARKTMVIAGGTNAGKTTLLRALINEVSSGQRIVTIEKARELGIEHLPELHPDVVALETREPNSEGEGGIDMRVLVRRGLRMDSDRVIVGEVLGDEIVDMLNAMSQGNDGSMCTIHANSSAGVFRRIATYATQAPERLDFGMSAALIGGAIDFIVFIGQRLRDDGKLDRAVSSIREVDPTGTVEGSIEIFGGDQLRALPIGLPSPYHLRHLEEVGYDATLLRHKSGFWPRR